MFEAGQIRKLTRPDIVEPGYMSPGRWHHVVEVYAGQGLLPPDFDLDGFILESETKQIPPWLLGALASLMVFRTITMAILFKVRGLNLSLRREINEHARTELALKESETKYRELVESANAIILRMGLDGSVTYFNEYAKRVALEAKAH